MTSQDNMSAQTTIVTDNRSDRLLKFGTTPSGGGWSGIAYKSVPGGNWARGSDIVNAVSATSTVAQVFKV